MVTACTPATLTQRQCGSVVVLFALLLPVLLSFTAFAADSSHLQLTKQELQNAADATALAGAAMLNATGGETPYNIQIGSGQQAGIAIAAFQISRVVRIGGKSFMQGNFTEGLKSEGLSAGGGGGQNLGAQTGIPSILIQ